MNKRSIILTGVRQNNLKNLNLKIPHDQLTVITGPSGSGKSSLAFETIFAEGQRLYIESLSTYARQFLQKVQRPEVDHIENISPTIALEQKNTTKNSRSTVGTSTEIYDYLRLMYSKIGKIYCPHCKTVIQKDTISNAVDFVLKKLPDQKIFVVAPFTFENLDPKAFVKNLIKRGFTRIYQNNAIEDLTIKTNLKNKKEIWIVLDRLKVSNKIERQLTDSLEIAYQQAHQRAIVIAEDKKIHKFSLFLRCSQCDLAFPEVTPSFFSFNNPYGACPECKGFGNNLIIDEELVIPNKNLTLDEGAVDPWTKPSRKKWQKKLLEFAEKQKVSTDIPYKNLSSDFKEKLLKGTKGFKGIHGFFKTLERKKYKMAIRVLLSRYKSPFPCNTCHGKRLRAQVDHVKINNTSITEVLSLTFEKAQVFFQGLKLSKFEKEATKEILRQIESRISFINKVGLEYLSLNRLTKTLSGGEAQRINLANQLGAALMQTTYVLDEPSIGLHPRDNQRLISLLENLRDLGNTVIVVEHEPDMIRKADYVIELGPQGGREGGKLIYEGSMKTFLKQNTLTSSYLTQKDAILVPKKRRNPTKHALQLSCVTHHNLKSVDLNLPLNLLVCITGVSGSGKSSLIHDTLYNAMARIFKLKSARMGKFKTISGFKSLRTIRLLDQSPIGKSSRSNPVTYLKAYDDIRKIFASVQESRKRGYAAGSFSFNIKGGRCENCEGTGFETLEMHFLSDLLLTCEQCNGKKFQKGVLEIRYKGKNIHDVLSMTVDEAYSFFLNYPGIRKKLKVLQEVGLGYLQMGQSANTLSGGEAQRLKIAKELSYDMKDCLYLLDEPTTGLHPDDIKKLLEVLNRLVDEGNSVIVIEHNLDVIKTADHVIDLGPEGGEGGGQIIAEGPPEKIVKCKKSYTGKFLKKALM